MFYLKMKSMPDSKNNLFHVYIDLQDGVITQEFSSLPHQISSGSRRMPKGKLKLLGNCNSLGIFPW